MKNCKTYNFFVLHKTSEHELCSSKHELHKAQNDKPVKFNVGSIMSCSKHKRRDANPPGNPLSPPSYTVPFRYMHNLDSGPLNSLG
jgi:hypothetical protein